MLNVTEKLISRNIRQDSEKKRVRALVENLAIDLANSKNPEYYSLTRALCATLVLKWQKAAPTDQGKADLLKMLRIEMGDESLVQLAAELWEHPLTEKPDPFKIFFNITRKKVPSAASAGMLFSQTSQSSQNTKKQPAAEPQYVEKREFNTLRYIDFAVDFFHPYETRSCVYAFLGHGYVGFSRAEGLASKIQAQIDLANWNLRPAKIQELTNKILNEISPMLPAERGYVPLYNQAIKVNFDALRQLPLAALECSELGAAKGTSQSMLSIAQLLDKKVIEVQDLTPELGLTAAHPLKFDPYAEHPQLAELYSLVSKNDAETCARLEEAAGLAVYRGSDLRSFAVLDGPPGSGKSLFLQSISAMCGKTVQYIGLEEFGEQFAGELGRDHEVFISDDQGSKPLPAKALSFLNTGTSGNPRYFNGKYIRPGDYTGRQVFYVACNTLPTIEENSVLDRMLLIEVDGRANTTTDWSSLFRDSTFLSAYFNRALRGALRMLWRKQHAAGQHGKISFFTTCEKAEIALTSYKVRSDLVIDWYVNEAPIDRRWKQGEPPKDTIRYKENPYEQLQEQQKSVKKIVDNDAANYGRWAAMQLGNKYYEKRDRLTLEKYKRAHERFYPQMIHDQIYLGEDPNTGDKVRVRGYILPEEFEKIKARNDANKKTRPGKRTKGPMIPAQTTAPAPSPAAPVGAAADNSQGIDQVHAWLDANPPIPNDATLFADPAKPSKPQQAQQPKKSYGVHLINGQPVSDDVFYGRTPPQPPFSDLPDQPDIDSDDDNGQGGAS